MNQLILSVVMASVFTGCATYKPPVLKDDRLVCVKTSLVQTDDFGNDNKQEKYNNPNDFVYVKKNGNVLVVNNITKHQTSEKTDNRWGNTLYEYDYSNKEKLFDGSYYRETVDKNNNIIKVEYFEYSATEKQLSKTQEDNLNKFIDGLERVMGKLHLPVGQIVKTIGYTCHPNYAEK